MEERTYVNDIDRSIYDIRNEEKDAYRIETGLSPAIVEQISREKGDPLWMELFRLESLQIYNSGLLIITHSTRILESLHVDKTHIMVGGRIVKTGGAALVEEINRDGFERYLGQ